MNSPVPLLVAALSAATIVCSTERLLAQSTPAALDERQYVDQVLRAGLEARVADAEAALGQAETVGAGAWSNPALGWQRESVETGPARGATQDIFSLSLPLVPSGRLGLERAAARENAGAALARRARARAELRHEALRRFYGAVAATERKAVLAESVARLRQLSETIGAREKAGDASGYDRLRIGLEAASVDDLLRGALLVERAAKAAALALLGPEHASLPPLKGSLSGLPPAAQPPRPEGLENRRADLRALKLDARSAETARRAAARGWVPEIALQAGVQVLDAGRPGESRGYVAGVELPLPLFQRRQGEGARAEARRNLAEAKASALLREANAQVAAAQMQVTERRTRLETHRTQVLARAEELRTIATAAYRGGASDLLALVDAERVAREARLSAIDLAAGVIDAESELRLVTGSYEESEVRSQKP